MADMDTYDGEQRGYEGNYHLTGAGNGNRNGHGYYGYNDRDYNRERSRSPGPDRDGDTRIRDEPMNGRADRGPPARGEDEGATNPGSNLFVTGIHPRLSEDEVSRLFEKYGVVEKCNIMRDPHTRESRGFGFVKMTTPEDADAAKDGLQGELHEGRTLSIEKARRARPRTPTPGKYFGPPKREDRPPRPGGGYRDRYDDRGYGRRDDRRGGGGGGYRDRYDDRSYGRRDDYSRSDRYRDDRYADRGGGRDRHDDRRGGGYGGYDRPPRAAPEASSYGAPRESAPRDYEERPRRYD